eukprot:357599_1
MAVPPVTSELQREVSEGTHHYLEETADNQLIEEIRDIISDIQETGAGTWHTNDDTINQYLYRHYKIMNNKVNKHHQNRIDYVLSEIDKQDIQKIQMMDDDAKKTSAQECDKIHRYFLNSTIQFGGTTEEAKANRTEKHEAGRRCSSKEHKGHNKTATAVSVGMKEE